MLYGETSVLAWAPELHTAVKKRHRGALADLTFTGLHIIIYFYGKTNQMHQFLKFILFWNNTIYVSDGLSVYCLEFKTVHTATGMSNRYCYLLASENEMELEKEKKDEKEKMKEKKGEKENEAKKEGEEEEKKNEEGGGEEYEEKERRKRRTIFSKKYDFLHSKNFIYLLVHCKVVLSTCLSTAR
jgi:hypothetical protein